MNPEVQLARARAYGVLPMIELKSAENSLLDPLRWEVRW
jgi:hypothetical protein